MRTRKTIVTASFLTVLWGTLGVSRDVAAQSFVPRDPGLGTASDITMVLGVGIVALMTGVSTTTTPSQLLAGRGGGTFRCSRQP